MGRRWAVVLACAAVAMAAAGLADPLAFLADDSWFYLVIGRNIAAGRGITFNGITGTNGFQPLWQAIVAGTLAVVRPLGITSPTAEARAVLVVGWVLLGLGLWRLDRLLRRFQVPPAGIALAALGVLAYLGGPLATLGSEADLVFLAVVVAVASLVDLVDRPEPPTGAAVRTGALLGVLVLARLDTGFLAMAALAVVVLAARTSPGRRVRLGAAAGASALAVVGPYLAWNQLRFGHLLPIAGAIKLDHRRVLWNVDALGTTGIGLLVLAVVLGAAAFVGRRPTRAEAVAVAVPLAGGLASSAIYFAWAPGRFTDLDWYRMPQLLAAGIAGGLVVRRVSARTPGALRWSAPILAVAVLLPLAVVFDQRLTGANHDFWHPVADASVRVGRIVPPGEVVASVDYPGVLAAFGGRPVLALDGLTGDYRFQEDLVARGPCALATRHVRWLLVDDADRLRPVPGSDDVTVAITSWLHHVDVGELRLRPDQRVRSFAGTRLSLWRVDLRCS